LQFEYDKNKSISNKSKHGINFEEAKSLWNDVEKMKRKIMQTITAKEFDTKFNNNEDISQYLNFSKSVKLKDFQSKQRKSM